MRVALIGCGRATEQLHLPALRHVAEAEVVALADIDSDHLSRVADKFQVPRRYTGYQDLINDPDVEVVAVCVPAYLHKEIGSAVLDANKHAFIEKPLALSLDESDALIERASQSRGMATVGFNLRRHRQVRLAREMVREGRMGDLLSMHSVLTSALSHRTRIPEWRQRPEMGGSVLFELATHHVDLWRFLTESEVVEVFATSRDEGPAGTTTLVARMANGALVTALFSEWTADKSCVEIFGSAGRLELSIYRFDGLKFHSVSDLAGGPQIRLREIMQMAREIPMLPRVARFGGELHISYQDEWRHFLSAVRDGTPLECTLQDGRQALQVVLAATASASTGRPVQVKDAPRKMPDVI